MARWLPLILLVGCASLDQGRLDEALRRPPRPDPIVHNRYVLYCPDRIAVTVTGAKPWNVERDVGVDGRVELPVVGHVRIQGQTLAEARRSLARALNLPDNAVQIEVRDFRSQQVFVHGQVAGEDRAVPYHGPETVLDVLRRAGGLETGADVAEVSIVRGHVAEGRTPEVFDVDVRAILLRNEPRSNIRVEPFDQIYIGQSLRFEFVHRLPLVFQPPCAYLLGIRQPNSTVHFPPSPSRPGR